MDKSSVTRPWNAGSLLIMGLGAGIFAGFVEGVGLLFFQRINWARWGPMMHVSWEIMWISPIVDAILFLSLALICAVAARLAPRLPVMRVLVFLLTFFSVYDWLTLTSRLYHRACLLLALGVAVGFRSLVRKAGKHVPAILEENHTVAGRGLDTRIRRNSRRQVAAGAECGGATSGGRAGCAQRAGDCRGYVARRSCFFLWLCSSHHPEFRSHGAAGRAFRKCDFDHARGVCLRMFRC